MRGKHSILYRKFDNTCNVAILLIQTTSHDLYEIVLSSKPRQTISIDLKFFLRLQECLLRVLNTRLVTKHRCVILFTCALIGNRLASKKPGTSLLECKLYLHQSSNTCKTCCKLITGVFFI